MASSHGAAQPVAAEEEALAGSGAADDGELLDLEEETVGMDAEGEPDGAECATLEIHLGEAGDDACDVDLAAGDNVGEVGDGGDGVDDRDGDDGEVHKAKRARPDPSGLAETSQPANGCDGSGKEEPAMPADPTAVALNPADCTIDLTISHRGLLGAGLSHGGFAYIWSGARANYGIALQPPPTAAAAASGATDAAARAVEGQSAGEGVAAAQGEVGVSAQGEGGEAAEGEGGEAAEGTGTAAAGAESADTGGGGGGGGGGGRYCFACVVEEEQALDAQALRGAAAAGGAVAAGGKAQGGTGGEAVAGIPEDERYLCRIGVSTLDTDVGSLGETRGSFAYGSTGKKSTGGAVSPYGRPFTRGDVVLCAVDLPARSLAFSLNGAWLGAAFRLPPLGGAAALAEGEGEGEENGGGEGEGRRAEELKMEMGNEGEGKEEGKEGGEESKEGGEEVKEAGEEGKKGEEGREGTREGGCVGEAEKGKSAAMEVDGTGQGSEAAGDGAVGGVDAHAWIRAALFPHVLVKNVKVRLQFSPADGLSPPPGYLPWSDAPLLPAPCAAAAVCTPPTDAAQTSAVGEAKQEARVGAAGAEGAVGAAGAEGAAGAGDGEELSRAAEAAGAGGGGVVVRVQGPAVAKREECEVLMMVGLPGSGKSTWAAERARAHPDRRYVVLGTDLVLDLMKVPGMQGKQGYGQRWAHLMPVASQVFGELLERAGKVPRNYIVDQTNVYAAARRRKLRPFEGFKKVAVVVVLTYTEWRRRSDRHAKETGKEVPLLAVQEMKANFVLPLTAAESRGRDVFDEVVYAALPRPQAQRIVDRDRFEAQRLLQAAAIPATRPFTSAPLLPHHHHHQQWQRQQQQQQQHFHRPFPRGAPMRPMLPIGMGSAALGPPFPRTPHRALLSSPPGRAGPPPPACPTTHPPPCAHPSWAPLPLPASDAPLSSLLPSSRPFPPPGAPSWAV
ncbi:hypothetical protein CLOM_g14396 [Closterium sp. NIES-68]|nr:hypothetical protein CLOM_g14396 [Closterium sp. NIES-68]